MYKNQLQELAQRSCFNLPSYVCTREGPDHAPRFKACVNFNGEVFESPGFTSTLRQAEHSAAQVALNVLTTRGPSSSLTARVLDETGVYKNLLQETAHRAGLKLPVYTTVRSGPGHAPIFTCSVEIAAMNFTGESAKTKKQAQKNAAIAAWSSLKTRSSLVSLFGAGSRNEENSREEGCKHPTRRREQNQSMTGRKIHNNLQYHHDGRQQQERRVMADSRSTCDTFVSLLPPPKPRPTSILPLPPPPQSVQVKKHEVPSLLGEHQRDEDEWLNSGKSTTGTVYGGSFNYTSSRIMPNQTHNSSMIMSSFIGGHDQCGRSMMNNPERMVPAIQIRSVIPVCAAPPQPELKLPPLTVKEAASATKHAPEEVNSVKVTSVLFNDKLQLK